MHVLQKELFVIRVEYDTGTRELSTLHSFKYRSSCHLIQNVLFVYIFHSKRRRLKLHKYWANASFWCVVQLGERLPFCLLAGDPPSVSYVL